MVILFIWGTGNHQSYLEQNEAENDWNNLYTPFYQDMDAVKVENQKMTHVLLWHHRVNSTDLDLMIHANKNIQ